MAKSLTGLDEQRSGTDVVLIQRTLFNRADYNPDLNGQSGTKKYERMRRDPEIAGALLRWKAPLSAAAWKFEEPESGDSAKEMTDLCNRFILGEGAERSSQTWKGGLLPHILLALDFGVTAFEKVWTVNDDGQQVYARLAPIPPQTIYEFELGDMNELVRIVQYGFTRDGYDRVTIPDPKDAPGVTFEDKVAVFTFRREGDNYFGRSLLRELYQPWFHKSELWTLDGMQKERSGMGLTVIKIPQTIVDTTSEAYVAAQRVAFELRAHERQGAVIGADWELTQSFPTGTPPDIVGSMAYCDEQIGRALAVEYSQLGSNSNPGSRSLGESKIDHFLLGLQAFADSIEEFVNTQLVPILCKRNFGPQEEYPKLQCENLAKMTGAQQAEVLKSLMAAGVVTYDETLEEFVREGQDLPKIDMATQRKPVAPVVVSPGQVAPGQGGAAQPKPDSTPATETPPDPQQGKKPAAPAAKAAMTSPAMPGPFHRELLPHEAHVDFPAIQQHLDSEPLRVWHRIVAPFRDQIIVRLSKAAAEASESALARGNLFGAEQRRPLEKRMSDELAAALLGSYRQGRTDVAVERAKQIGPSKAAGDAPYAPEDDEIAPTETQTSWIRRIAESFVATMYLGLTSEAIKSAFTSRQAGLAKSEIERRALLALNALSVPVAQANLAGVLTRAYTTGRVEQGATYPTDNATVYYSAVMDERTCEVCSAFDGREIDPGEIDTLLPNPNCLGDNRCRCIPVWVYDRQAQAA